MASQYDIATAFARGDPASSLPSGSNFYGAEAPQESEFDAVLLSYGWAVVAGRRPDGSIVVFDGWSGYSTSTATQMGKMRRAFADLNVEYEKSDEQPRFGGNTLNWRVRKDGTPLTDIET